MTTSVEQSPDRPQGETGSSEIDARPSTLSGGPLDTGTAREVLSGRLSGSQTTPPASPPAGGGGAKTGTATPTKEGSAPPAGGALGAAPAHLSRYNTNNVSTSEENPRSDAESATRQSRRNDRYENQRAVWDITSLKRVEKCGRATHGGLGDGRAALVMNTGTGVAHWSGFCFCGSIWACPVCSAKIRASRADEIARAVAGHIVNGGNAWMITLTARHKKWHDLEPLFDAVAKGFRKIISGAPWAGAPKRGVRGEKHRLGVRGYIRSMEVTYGTRNGWHPHLHIVLLTQNETADALMAAMARWDAVWRREMKKKGFEPSKEHGTHWAHVKGGEQAGEYIAKVQEGKGHLGHEMARGDLKQGRLGTLAPFELLTYFRKTGDLDVVPVWHEYEQGTYNRRAITWSRGLRKELLEDEPEKTDEEVAEEEVGGDVWAIFPAETLHVIRRVPGLRARLLDIAENGGFPDLVAELTRLHLEYEIGTGEIPEDPGV